jgi:HEAT repeats
MLTELKKLAGDFTAKPLTRGREIRDLLEHSPGQFCSAAVEILGEEGPERVKRYLIALLWTNNLLIPCLTDPAVPSAKAEHIAALARRVDPQLPAKLVGFVLDQTGSECSESIDRILGLLKAMPDVASLRPLLTPLLRHPNERIRAKVASFAGQGNRNRTWLERRMLEDDPRVRANVIECAGAAAAEDLRPLFRTAANDSNNRVVGNALIALYRLGDVEAVGNLRDLACRPEPAFRATAVWAMAETGDTRFLPVLAKMLTDSNEATKGAAFKAFRKLRTQDGPRGLPLEVRILGDPCFSGSGWNITFVVSDGRNPVPGIAPTAIRVLANREFIYRYMVTEQECRRRIAAAFLLPRSSDQNQEKLDNYRRGLEKCFGQRRLGDSWMLSQHSLIAGARTETLFGVRIDARDGARVLHVSSLPDLQTAFEPRAMAGGQDFTQAFVSLCQELRPSRISAHLFAVHPETAQGIDTTNLIRAAQDAHVSIHAICASRHAAFAEICRATGGFYAVGEDIAEMLPAVYGGISHRYVAAFEGGEQVQRVQISIRNAESFGESQVADINCIPTCDPECQSI